MERHPFDILRREMVQIIALYAEHTSAEIGKDALDPRVLEVMGRVPRHEFVPAEMQPYAYLDGPLPIGFQKTISQPFMAAIMTDLLELQPGDAVLEVGTGLGYHAAVMAQLAGQVFSVEIVEELGLAAEKNLRRLEYSNIVTRIGDGSRGWPEHAPFDKVLVAAAPELLPSALIEQLKPGGRMVVPAGLLDAQQLLLVEKDEDNKLDISEIMPVRFSPLEVIN